MCRNLFIPFPFYSFSSFPFLSDIAYFFLNLLENFKAGVAYERLAYKKACKF